MSMLTLEDVNTLNTNHINEFYELNTSNISTDTFSSVQYDFCRITHTVSSGTHTFTFEIHNSLWTGAYYLLKSNGTLLNVTGSYDSTNSTLTVSTTETSVRLGLYLCSLTSYFNCVKATYVFDDTNGHGNPLYTIYKNQLGSTFVLELIEPDGGNSEDVSVTISQPGAQYVNVEGVRYYILVLIKKSDLDYSLSSTTLTTGILNKVYLNVDSKYLPGGSMVGSDSLDVEVEVDNQLLSVSYDSTENDYYFELDLTEKADTNSVKMVVNVYETDYINHTSRKVQLNCSYVQVNSFESLNTQLVNGVTLIELTDDILFTNNLTLPQSLKVIGDNYNFDLQGYSITVTSNYTCNLENVRILSGNPCFIQQNNTNLILTDCYIESSLISDTYKGSVVNSINDNTQATIDNCTVINCPHTIYYEGNITITNSEFLYDTYDANKIDTDYSMLLTIYNGAASIVGNTFDINFDTTSLCSNEIDIKYASSLIGIGETATINGYTVNRINDNNKVPLFDYNNVAHTYIQYYYTELEECVIMSPLLGKETESCCHTLLGTDYVFKNNLQITTVTSGNANTINPINIGE